MFPSQFQTQIVTKSMESEWVNKALRRFLHNHGNIATEGSPTSGLCPTLTLWEKLSNNE